MYELEPGDLDERPNTTVFGQPAIVGPLGSPQLPGIGVTLPGDPFVDVRGADSAVWAFLSAASADFIDRAEPVDDGVPLGPLPDGYEIIANIQDSPGTVIAGEGRSAPGEGTGVVVGVNPYLPSAISMTTVQINGVDGWLFDGMVVLTGGDIGNDSVSWPVAPGFFATVVSDTPAAALEAALAAEFIPTEEWLERYGDDLNPDQSSPDLILPSPEISTTMALEGPARRPSRRVRQHW